MKFPIPNVVNKEFYENRSLNNCDILLEHRWHYVEFLFEFLKTPRNKTEELIKERYQYAYLQFKNLKLSAKQYRSCGRHKQVFLLSDTVPHRVIKIFHSSEEWIREKNHYAELQKLIPDLLLPHEYRESYAICDCVELLHDNDTIVDTKSQVEKIWKEKLWNKNNRRDFEQMLKLIKNNDCRNLGVWQDRLVWIDVGDFYARVNGFS